jgi:alpha-N-arabinofuranosidase
MPSREGEEAGLTALQNDAYWYAIALGTEHGRRVLRLRRRAGPDMPADGAILATAPAPDGPVRLRVSAEGATYRFAFAGRDGQWHAIGGDLDGSILSTHTAGGFVGAVFGVYAVAR